MRTIFYSLIAVFVAAAVYSCAVFGSGRAEERLTIEDGVYEGIGHGYHGLIHVKVHLEGGIISGIDIINSEEDLSVGVEAMEELIDLVIEYNSTDVDVISGATESSRGFLEAIENAIIRNE